MTDFTIHTTDSAAEASRDLLEGAQPKYGFVPNLIGAMAEAQDASKTNRSCGCIGTDQARRVGIPLEEIGVARKP